MASYVLAAVDWADVVCSGWHWFDFLPNKTGPVVSQDIMDPSRKGLVTVAGHLMTIRRVLQM